MLTAKEIGKYIVSPETIQASDLDELKSLSEKYPYTQLFSILYLKGMSASNSVDFETSLKEHSYRISDRGQLYKLIHDHDSKTPDSIIEQEITVEEKVITTTETPHSIEELKPIETVEPNISLDEPVQELEDEIFDSIELTTSEQSDDVAPEVIVETVTPEIEEQVQSQKDEETGEKLDSAKQLRENLQFEIESESKAKIEETEKPKDGLEESILHHVYANQYQLPELTDEEKAELEKKKEEKYDPPKKSEETEISEKEIRVNSKQSFTNWLHANSNYSEPSDIEKKAINSLVDDFAAFDPLESLSGEFEKPKKEFFSPSKKAKESLSENKLPVSETLAKIYVMQGNYPKAISAYNELILAFPEKKIFFANQIEDLKKKLNK